MTALDREALATVELTNFEKLLDAFPPHIVISEILFALGQQGLFGVRTCTTCALTRTLERFHKKGHRLESSCAICVNLRKAIKYAEKRSVDRQLTRRRKSNTVLDIAGSELTEDVIATADIDLESLISKYLEAVAWQRRR